MVTPVPMPALSPTMTEGKITKWLKKEGEPVTSGQAIAEVETDKSNLEVEAYDDGFLLKVLVHAGESAKVGAPIAFIGGKGETVEMPAAGTAKPPPPPPAAAPGPVPAPAVVTVAAVRPVPRVEGRLRASPLAKKIARDQGLNLAAVHGSGPQGRIVKRDVESALVQPVAGPAKRPAAPVSAGVRRVPEAIPLSSMRKVIAQRMTEVKPGVPHFYLTADVEMDAALKIREEAKALDSKISVNDIVVKAVGLALRRYPKMNVSFAGDHMLQYSSADVGVAVAIEDGLITPVIRDADQKGLEAISQETRELAERARKRALKPDEYTGGSITVSNLGMYGIDSFVALINPPQAAILAIGAVTEKAVVREHQVVVRRMMSITLSGDHRVIDGATGAEYLRELRALLEHPLRLIF